MVLYTEVLKRNACGLTPPPTAAEDPGEGAPSGRQVAAAAMQRAQEGHSQTPHLLLAPRSRLMGPRREGQTDSSDAEFKGHIHFPDSA